MDTHESFEGLTKDEVLELIKKYGCPDNMEETQNDSPSVQEFLDIEKKYKDIKYIGYIIKKPRTDFRVSIEGFTLVTQSADEAIQVLLEYKYADEADCEKRWNNYELRFWWD